MIRSNSFAPHQIPAGIPRAPIVFARIAYTSNMHGSGLKYNETNGRFIESVGAVLCLESYLLAIVQFLDFSSTLL